MIGYEPLLAAFILGLMGAGHCLGMCGGIAGALAFAIPNASLPVKFFYILCYNIGRASSYTFMGGVVGFLGAQFSMSVGVPILKILSGLLLIAMGFYLAEWWKVLTYMEKLGANIWRFIQPYANRLFPLKSPLHALILGMLWGWLPCGLVYSALVYAASLSSAVMGALLMLSFALGTLPAVFMGGLAGQTVKQFVNKPFIKIVLGLGFILYGSWVLLNVGLMLSGNSSHHMSIHH